MSDLCWNCKSDELMYSVTYGYCPECDEAWKAAGIWWCADCGEPQPKLMAKKKSKKKRKAHRSH